MDLTCILATKTPSFTPVATATVGLPAGAGLRLQWTARPREIGLFCNHIYGHLNLNAF